MNYLNQLNEVQKNAVISKDGPTLVVAGAGSGKTRVLTYRIAYLLASGVPPYKILALTFTNKAAREMKERIASVVGSDLSASLWMGTFHSIFSKILRFEAEKIGFPADFTIYDSQDSRNLIKSIIKELNLDDSVYKPAGVQARISMAKNNLITSQSYKNNAAAQETDRASKRPEIFRIFELYTHRCIQSGAMDFDDLLLYTNILFRDHPDILSKYQDKFKYILVDEYQDTNFAQYLIVKKLGMLHQNICVVGDDAQSIYSFRGAKIENILNFKNDYPQHKLFKLEQNYRSTQTIVDAANSLIKKNEKQIPKVVFSENEQGEKINVIDAYTDKEEGYLIVNDIFDQIAANRLEFKDFAILYRTNMQSRIFEEALRKRNFPYKIYGGLSFYQRKEVKDMIAYFRMVINPNDGEAFKRVINYPVRGIGATTLNKIEAAANHFNTSMWSIAKHLDKYNTGFNKGTINKIMGFVELISGFQALKDKNDAYDMARLVAVESGLLKDLQNGNTIEERTRFENVEELLNGIRDFATTNYVEGNPAKLSSFLENVALLTDQDSDNPDEKNRITMMTIHSAKGLEFPHVYIVGLEEELFPSAMSSNTQSELEEERRLFYVAITRAEKKATLSFCRSRYKFGTPTNTVPSRFIREIDSQYLGQKSMFERSSMNSSNWDTAPDNESRIIKQGGFKKPVQLGTKLSASRKLHQMSSAANTDFEADDARKLQSGMNIEHAQFGQGRVLKIEGDGDNKKAIIFFQQFGEKKLLLRFAKVKIL